MHVTNVIYFPFQDVKCNMYVNGENAGDLSWHRSLSENPVITWSEVAVCLFLTHGHECHRNTGLSLCNATIKAQKKKSFLNKDRLWGPHSILRHEMKWCNFSLEDIWRCFIWLGSCCLYCSIFILTLLLLAWICFCFAFPLLCLKCLLCVVLKINPSCVLSLFTVSDIYKDRISRAIPLKAPWDTPHLALCSSSIW